MKSPNSALLNNAVSFSFFFLFLEMKVFAMQEKEKQQKCPLINNGAVYLFLPVAKQKPHIYIEDPFIQL